MTQLLTFDQFCEAWRDRVLKPLDGAEASEKRRAAIESLLSEDLGGRDLWVAFHLQSAKRGQEHRRVNDVYATCKNPPVIVVNSA